MVLLEVAGSQSVCQMISVGLFPGRNENHYCIAARLQQPLGNFDSVHIGHVDVDQGNVGLPLLDEFNGLSARACVSDHVDALGDERPPSERPETRVVVDENQAQCHPVSVLQVC